MINLKKPFAKLRGAVVPEQPEFTSFPDENRRTAVLVIHGIGAQKAYTTLDQFARGLMRRFGGTAAVQQEVKFRHWSANPINRQQDWTQTFLRLTPANAKDADRVVDVFEYYWAPVITDLVTARQSLRFLLFSALSPFQYLRDNLAVIDSVQQNCRQAPLLNSWETFKRSWELLMREIYRIFFIFLPFLLLIGALYWLISMSANKLVNIPMKTYFHGGTLSVQQLIGLGLTCIRWLILAMSALFLFEEFFKNSKGVARAKSGTVYRLVMGSLFLILLFGPLIDAWASRFHLPVVVYWVAGITAMLALPYSATLRNAFFRALQAIGRHPIVSAIASAAAGAAAYVYFFPPSWLAAALDRFCRHILHLPTYVQWAAVANTALIAVLAYFVNMFLKSAIGGLAVYLGSDDLSKNYAARSQILHECSETILQLLGSHRDLARDGVDQHYDQVLIAAHSLGSVIAFDMLNQLIVRQQACDPRIVGSKKVEGLDESKDMPVPDLTKIKGLLTFGCPLNKVVYFFRTRTSLATIVLERILFVLHPFRLTVPLSTAANTATTLPFPYPVTLPFGGRENFQWINAYSPFDLISGKMFFYCADDDVLVEKGVMPWTAHLSYWENDSLYQQFAKLV